MSTSRTPRWFAGWRSASLPQPDAADFGTAFGLDLSLIAAAEAAESRAAPTAATRRGWMQRLVLTRRAVV